MVRGVVVAAAQELQEGVVEEGVEVAEEVVEVEVLTVQVAAPLATRVLFFGQSTAYQR